MQIKAKREKEVQSLSWDDFYKETDPAGRLAIYDACRGTPDPDEAARIGEILALRYSKSRRGEYADNFMRTWMELLFLARSAGDPAARSRTAVRASKKKQEKELAAYHKAFGLDRAEEFSKELLQKELVHMCASYAVISADDKTYSRMLFGIGRIKDEKVKNRIVKEFRLVQKYLAGSENRERFALLDAAIEQTIADYL